MKIIKKNNFEIIYNEKYQKEKTIVIDNFNKILQFLNKYLENRNTNKVKIYIIKSKLKYIYHTYPIIRKIFIFTILLPVWLLRERKVWDFWKGICHHYPNYSTMLLRPMEVYNKLNSNIAELFLRKNEDLLTEFEHNLCYELSLTYIKNLQLPFWLRVGFANYVSDNFVKVQTVENKSINLLKLKRYTKISIANIDFVEKEYVAYNYAKGYWFIKYLEEKYPGFLKEIFKKYRGENIVNEIGKKLGLDINDKEELWIQIDELLYEHYNYLLSE